MMAEQIIKYMVSWLDEYSGKSGLGGFVVGVSGGIDSAVTSALCAKTNRSVYALNMPIYQAPDQESLSDNHIKWLTSRYPNVRSAKINLTSALKAFEHILPYDLQDGLTMANTRSRVRMITLYAYAGHHKMLVAGTGNKVEDFGVGFFTKYGDGGVDVSPIADLLKTEVYEIGETLGIDANILKAPPTDGLWTDNRTDESQIGATYGELEWAMKLEENDVDMEKLTDRQKKVLSTYRKFNTANRHKMQPIPVCYIPSEFRK
jgi:NAD+ synthase